MLLLEVKIILLTTLKAISKRAQVNFCLFGSISIHKRVCAFHVNFWSDTVHVSI